MPKQKNIALFFGSFNPIHIGHLVIANHIANNNDVDEVWFVVSPQNPFKEKKTLLQDYHRLQLVNEAIEGNEKLKASNIEFSLPQPSYTVDTLIYLKEKYPDINFSIIMGEDNIKSFHKWKNHDIILRDYKLIVYPRVNVGQELNAQADILGHKNVTLLHNIPIMDISASYIRNNIKENKSIRYLVTDSVLKYIDEMNFYKK
jgi:nicotinate-nucleotide adenylyltransferase